MSSPPHSSTLKNSMEITPLFLYESFVLVVGVAAVLAFAAVYFRLLRGYTALQADYDVMQKKLSEQASLLSQASAEQLKRMVADTHVVSESLKKELVGELRAQASKESSEYGTLMDEVGAAVQQQSLAEVKAFTQELATEAKSAEQEVSKNIAKLYDAAEADITAMRGELRATLEKEIYAIIGDVVKETTGKLLTREDHDHLVTEALTKAMANHG